MADRYMLDTNVFNDLCDGRVRLEDLVPGDGAIWVVTHVQRDELAATRDTHRRMQLLDSMSEVAPDKQATASAVWGVSTWDEASWPPEPSKFEAMLAALDAKKKKDNNVQDILIAETALHFGYVLATSDGNLRAVMEQFGGKVLDTRSGSQTPGA